MNRTEIGNLLVQKINKSDWWHVPPRDVASYNKRGKFLASSFLQAEFYGRPNDIPEKVKISAPVFGFTEDEILEQLFPGNVAQIRKDFKLDLEERHDDWYEKRTKLDAKMFQHAREKVFDAIVLLNPTGRKYIEKRQKPHSIELNLLYP